MTLLVNLYGPPGAGKSTTRAALFSRLKIAGYNVEECTEYAKDLTWEKRTFALSCQPYVFGKQLRNLERLMNQVDAVITDSPLLLSNYYLEKYPSNRYAKSFYKYVEDQSAMYNSLDVFIERQKAYNPAGRNQTEAESDQIGIELKTMLTNLNIDFMICPSIDDLFKIVCSRIDQNI